MSPDMINFADWAPVRILADIEAMIRREGHRQYCANDTQDGFYRSQLCGVTAHLVRKSGMMRLYTHDLDIVIASDGTTHFTKGNVAALRLWHNHLSAYRRAMRTTSGNASIAA